MTLGPSTLWRKAKERGARALAERHDSWAVRKLASAASSLNRAVQNDSADFVHNGEARVLDVLATTDPVTVFDVGAHHGGWAQEVLRRFPAAQLHCFEIEPRNRARLTEAVGNDGRVVIAEVGLGAEPGMVDVWYDHAHPDMTSSFHATGATERVASEVTTGDRYIEAVGIGSVDFLKIDVEGADLAVLRGFSEALAEGRVGVVQFEFTMWAAVARTWLADFHDLLEPNGFTVGKIFPYDVDFHPYRADQEVFVRANYLGVHESRRELIQRLER